MTRRVVITGMGVIAPNGNGLAAFEEALRKGQSGIRHVEKMAEAKFACTVGGVPQGIDELANERFAEDELLAMNMSHRYASLATLEAWEDAGLVRPSREDDTVDWDSGAIIGTGIGGMDTTAEFGDLSIDRDPAFSDQFLADATAAPAGRPPRGASRTPRARRGSRRHGAPRGSPGGS